MYEICDWGFIVNEYVPIKRLGTFDRFPAAQAAVKEEWKRRDTEGRYTDMGTFAIRKMAA